jgi:predicted Zn-dependent peptidase
MAWRHGHAKPFAMKPFRRTAAAVLPFLLAACAVASGPVLAPAPVPAVASPAPVQPAPLAQLVQQVDIPYETFTLPNGLTTIVHTDRKAPIVGVAVYYRVGSKHEPRGHTGFAHLFEHLMFGGSENVANFDVPLEAAGSSSTNGSTWYDRTNYVETVPTGALDLALFEESDRMGYLLGAVTQAKLDAQRSVVQNEKRQGDNEPYGLVQYKIGDALFPIGHPYRHSTIGSMADLDAASVADVHQWFKDHYGPNNVVVALSGDIDAAAARPLVERWFGTIPPGPAVAPVAAQPVTLAAPVAEQMADQVPVTRIYRVWSGPALTDPDAVPLAAGLYVLGGLASSRLDNALVRGDQLAVSVTAGVEQHEQIGFLQASMDVKPGVDVAQAQARFDQVIAELIADGPSQDELTRAATRLVSSQIGALEVVGGFYGKGATLAEGLLYAGDPANYKKELERLATITPAEVKAALQRWLTRPPYTLTVVPGERTEDGAKLGGWGDEGTAPPPPKDPKKPVTVTRSGAPRAAPPVLPVADVTFPAVQHATLSNGIPVSLARRTAIPKASLALSFDAGEAADGGARTGTQSLMMDLLEEGTRTRSAEQIAIEEERLGASIGTGTSRDESTVSLTALTANLTPSLELMADLVRHPAFNPADVARVKAQRLAEIAQEQADPTALASRAFGPLVYGDAHPYGSVGGSGKAAVVQALTPEAIAAEHDTWLRPDLARITVVGNVTMAELLPRLEAVFGDWRAPASSRPVKDLTAAVAPQRTRLVLIDRPNSPQSVVLLGRVLPLTGRTQGIEALGLANEVLGNGFLSRLNTHLREEKGWTYGISSSVPFVAGPRALAVLTPVQTDRTADSIRLILEDMAAFPAKKGVDPTELQRVTEGNIRNLPSNFETNGQVLSAMLRNELLGRPDDYYARLPAIYRTMDAASIDAAARQYLGAQNLAIVVVGDRSKIESQLKTLNLPIEYLEASQL